MRTDTLLIVTTACLTLDTRKRWLRAGASAQTERVLSRRILHFFADGTAEKI